MNRRLFLAACGLSLASPIAFAKSTPQGKVNLKLIEEEIKATSILNATEAELGSKSLKLFVPKIGIRDEVVFYNGSSIVKPAIKDLQTLFKDARTGAEHPICTDLVMILSNMSDALKSQGKNCEITVHSAYRSPKSNKKVGGKRNSLHLQNKAIDIEVNGVSFKELTDIAIASGARGIGNYNGFLHIDSGLIGQPDGILRKWGD